MAYFMVHLNIAQSIYEQHSGIKDKGAFYLGAIAPDAIAFRQGSVRSDKKATHFCIGDEDWGGITNCDEWQENLIVNTKRYKGIINDDFLFGYCTHVVADIETNRRFYGPVREKHDDQLIKAYVKDCSAAETILLDRMKNRDELWPLLYQSNQYELPGLNNCQNISSMIDFMKNELYANMLTNPEYHASIYDITDFMMFIENTIHLINTLW